MDIINPVTNDANGAMSPGNDGAALALVAVTKRYGRRIAVADLNLVVARGEVFGFLGPNGAGKTTTIRLLTGFIRPSGGTVQVFGRPLTAATVAVRRTLGFVPDVAGLDPTMSGQRLLDQLAALQGQPPVDRAAVAAALELAPADLHRPIGVLSRGTRQKINIIQGLQHRPALLVLDEPTEGLDPLGKAALFDLLRAAQRRGATIFFSSHILSEVEALCDRVGFMRQGRLVAVDHLASLRAQQHQQVTLRVARSGAGDLGARLARLPSVIDLVREEQTWYFGIKLLPPLLALLAMLPVEELRIEPPSLATLFRAHYRDMEEQDG